jgi:hypothetical protein
MLLHFVIIEYVAAHGCNYLMLICNHVAIWFDLVSFILFPVSLFYDFLPIQPIAH